MPAHRVLALATIAALSFAAAPVASATITIPTVPVVNPGNAADATGFGSVAYSYNIGTYEVTAGQYTAFLNAVARTDTNTLYHSSMSPSNTFGCGITRSGNSGGYAYTVDAAFAQRPVNYVSFWDATRFSNWLHNGQPSGAQNSGTTEDGAYTLTPGGVSDNTITRNAGWQWAVTSENEWYKAAYHQPSNAGGDADNYWLYPTSSNTITTAQANFANAIGNTTSVGSYAANFYGAFDMGGNVWEWNDTIVEVVGDGSDRVNRGGAFDFNHLSMQSFDQDYLLPYTESAYQGFRVSQIPGPSSVALLAVGGVFAGRRRRQGRPDRATRSTTTRARVGLAATVFACSATSVFAQPTLTLIPSDSASVTGDVDLYGVSHDGQVVWGRDSSTGRQWFWSEAAGKQYGIPRPAGTGFGQRESFNGGVSAGYTFEGRPNTPLPVYRNAGQPDQVIAVPAPSVSGWAEAVSSQGNVVVGTSSQTNFDASGFFPYQPSAGAPFIYGHSAAAFRWTDSGSYQALTYNTRSLSRAFGVSADGSVVVGTAHNGGLNSIVDAVAVRWDSTGVGTAVSPAGILATATNVSPDGNVVCGLVYDSVNNLSSGTANSVFRWTVGTGYEVIDSRANFLAPYGILGMSADGSTIATTIGLWRADVGYIDYHDLFAQANPPQGVELESINGISDDGRRIAGLAFEFDGVTERWRPFVLTVPAPSVASLLGLGVLMTTRRRRRVGVRRVT